MGKFALLLATCSHFAVSQSQVSISFVQGPGIFAGKDSVAFARIEEDEGIPDSPSPQDLVLNSENVFVGAFGTLEGDASSVTSVFMDFAIEGEVVEADVGPFIVRESDGRFVVYSGDLSADFLTIGERGTKGVEVTIKDQDGIELGTAGSEVFVIGGFESVLPLVMLVVFALLSRNVYVAMFFGIWLGSFIIERGNLTDSFTALFDDHMIPSITDEFNFRTIMFTLFLGGFLAMIKRAGGQDGFSEAVGKYAKSAKSTQLAAVGAGFGLFFDDYSSVLILGSSFKKLTDAYHVSREKLAFVADATSAPIASIAPISSWIAFELSQIQPELDNIEINSEFKEQALKLDAAYTFFLQTIPSRYYPFYMLVVQVVLIAAGVEFGPMLYAERKTRLNESTDGGEGRMEIPLEQDVTTPADDTPRKAWNFFVPLGFFIISLLVSLVNIGKANIESANEDLPENEQIELIAREVFGNTDSFAALVYTTMGASLFALFFFLVQCKKDGEIVIPTASNACAAIDCRLKKLDDVAAQEGFEVPDKDTKPEDEESQVVPIMYFTEGINIWVEGFKNLVPAVLILCLAFTIKSIVTGLGTDRLFTEIILDSDIKAEALPTIIFIVSGMLAIATGTSFGTMSIMFPLISFAAFEKSEGDIELFTVSLSSIMAGAVFGDHSSLISDTTILSSIGAGCQIGAHVYTQAPYALWAALFAILFGTLPAGLGVEAGAVLGVGMLIVGFATLFAGAPIVAESGRLDIFSELVLRLTGSESLQQYKEATRDYAREKPQKIDPEPFVVLKGLWGGKYGAGESDPDKRNTVDELDAIAEDAENFTPTKAVEQPAEKQDV